MKLRQQTQLSAYGNNLSEELKTLNWFSAIWSYKSFALALFTFFYDLVSLHQTKANVKQHSADAGQNTAQDKVCTSFQPSCTGKGVRSLNHVSIRQISSHTVSPSEQHSSGLFYWFNEEILAAVPLLMMSVNLHHAAWRGWSALSATSYYRNVYSSAHETQTGWCPLLRQGSNKTSTEGVRNSG